jgi:RNA polymerase sigma-70 factor (ECF subfamily)
MESRSDPPEPAAARGLGPAPAAGAGRRDARSAQQVAAFSDFYRAFVPTLVAFLVWQGARLADAADIAQDTMAEAYRAWHRIDRPEAWARRVASRAYARRIASIEEDPVDAVPDARSPLLPNDADPEAFIGRHEVLHLLTLLPPRQRQVMAWTFDGHSPTEIAEELTMTPGAVRASLSKARRALAAHLAAAKEAETR